MRRAARADTPLNSLKNMCRKVCLPVKTACEALAARGEHIGPERMPFCENGIDFAPCGML